MTLRVLHLEPVLAGQVLAAAQTSFPAECCGLLEGSATDDGWMVNAVHRTANVAQQPERHFLIDPQAHIALLRRLRGTGRAVIGCFHSHPRGRPEPSLTDRATALEKDFLWLIAGGEPEHFVLRAHLFSGDEFRSVELRPSGDCG